MPPCWNRSVCVSSLICSIVLATVQSAPGETPPADNATFAVLQRAPDSAAMERAARTIDANIARTLWDDPQTRNFIGLSENSYDFTDPNGAPGFGAFTPTELAR